MTYLQKVPEKIEIMHAMKRKAFPIAEVYKIFQTKD